MYIDKDVGTQTSNLKYQLWIIKENGAKYGSKMEG